MLKTRQKSELPWSAIFSLFWYDIPQLLVKFVLRAWKRGYSKFHIGRHFFRVRAWRVSMWAWRVDGDRHLFHWMIFTSNVWKIRGLLSGDNVQLALSHWKTRWYPQSREGDVSTRHVHYPRKVPTIKKFAVPWDTNPYTTVKATFHLTISVRGQRATGKLQRNNYHHGSCGRSLTGKTMSVFLIFTQGTHRNVENRWVRSIL